MLTLDEAKAIANKEIATMVRPDLDLVLLDEFTVAKPYGWVFFFNTRKYQETKDSSEMVFGNGPLVVRHNKKLDRLTSAGRPDAVVAAFEKKHGLRGS